MTSPGRLVVCGAPAPGQTRAVLKISLRSVLSHKLRLALIALAVVLGVAFASGMLMLLVDPRGDRGSLPSGKVLIGRRHVHGRTLALPHLPVVLQPGGETAWTFAVKTHPQLAALDFELPTSAVE